jgi:hypothetical protein
VSSMSPDDLRQAMRTPGRAERMPDVGQIIRSARGKRRRRRIVAGTLMACTVGAVVPLVNLLPGQAGVLVGAAPSASPSTSARLVAPHPSLPTPTTTPTPPPSSPPSHGLPSTPPAVVIAADAEQIELGEGWSTWNAGSEICVQNSDADYPLEACTSTTDGNQSSDSLGVHRTTEALDDGSLLVVTYKPNPVDAAVVTVSYPDEDDVYAQVVRFTAVPGWTLYFSLVVYPAAQVPASDVTVTAYDAAGNVIATSPDTSRPWL